ncbi:TniQ family protein [Salipiger thiooxidans]|uniref:TniQ family protein n=1 Tax=Salipiger thiooxidans TaxID=282683 RepID=UPI001CD457B0|nr:TniQ family protein [Salipiger thiooxidans]MCA0851042.1 TniQ family protein [Salipiger thiooxidans]
MAKSLPAIPGNTFPQLPLTVQHAAFEPASSLLSRLAARGGASSMQRFCGDIAFPIDPLFRGEGIAIEQLAQLAGCDAAALEWVSVRHLGKGHFRLRDEFASLQSFQRLRVRVCPECVRAESPSAAESWRVPRRLQWKFSSIRSCPEHGCMLVNLPPEKFSKDARDFSAQLRKHYGWILDQRMIPAELSPFEQYLSDRILKGRGDRWIDRLELNVVSRACEVLGLRIAKGPDASLAGHIEADWMSFAAMGYDVLKDGPVALSECLAAMAREDRVDGRFFGRVFGAWATWLNNRSLGDEFEPLRDVVRRHVFDHFSVRRGVLVLGVPSEGKAALNAQKPFPLKGFAKRNAEDLVRRGLAKRQADGCIVPTGFVTQRMLEAYEREKKFFPACKGSGARVPVEALGADAKESAGEAHLSISAVAQELRVTAKTVGYLVENGLLHGVDAAELYRRGTTVVTADSLVQFQAVFISLGELADVAQRPQGALSMRLRNAELALLAMPHDLSRIYWREDVRAYVATEQ